MQTLMTVATAWANLLWIEKLFLNRAQAGLGAATCALSIDDCTAGESRILLFFVCLCLMYTLQC